MSVCDTTSNPTSSASDPRYGTRLCEFELCTPRVGYRPTVNMQTRYKAWSAIVYQLIPNVGSMEQKLKQFAEIMDADEVLLFEKATFLVIAQAQRVPHDDLHRFEKV